MSETVEVPEPPEAAREVFTGEAWERAKAFAGMLAGPAVVRGLVGPREVPRLWDRHLLNCAVVGEAVPENASVVDVGSGAGLPGLVLAIVRPDLSVTLLEPLLRRTVFLTECVEGLGLDNVEVVRGRAEELVGKAEFDVATARAVAPLERLVRWTLPLLRQGGELIAMKGERAEAELEEAEAQLRACGAETAELLQVGRGKVDPPATLVRVVAGRAPVAKSGAKRRSRQSDETGQRRAGGTSPRGRRKR
ncbi:16S rRNA (guanine(527)-N(7))-methyltransferase RsmG [Bailinhaonella thermotolerans]|uniref:Ribosomal RNA small subunit methyltransferase G n=1 Tax=Bailinhaonella thermotolerans TaxID=1070861 RepID=A0A3A4B453_9ACTN|nr:16S rRNA (guanine(527)-N(7))-methyltransferase RsmG [Bailinhaonella thermotolerans]RJL32150.1 16S rRNA (guanine(527)-N(7))-methyltransferase RsmG [Bailinhaonella thermotolerans]